MYSCHWLLRSPTDRQWSRPNACVHHGSQTTIWLTVWYRAAAMKADHVTRKRQDRKTSLVSLRALPLVSQSCVALPLKMICCCRPAVRFYADRVLVLLPTTNRNTRRSSAVDSVGLIIEQSSIVKQITCVTAVFSCSTRAFYCQVPVSFRMRMLATFTHGQCDGH